MSILSRNKDRIDPDTLYRNALGFTSMQTFWKPGDRAFGRNKDIQANPDYFVPDSYTKAQEYAELEKRFAYLNEPKPEPATCPACHRPLAA